ncbi:MAG: DUF4153 domain-containing protein [Lachnospiraceae bacterium]|jgi:hypothetical protein|nr:DUF4153 domain-containing protein [Lachnospiraceae bacterium]
MNINSEMILENIANPKILEDLYRSNKRTFSETIKAMYNEDSDIVIKYWYTRLFHKSIGNESNPKKYIFTALLIVFTWIPVRLIFVNFFDESIYLARAIPIIFSLTLSLFFLFETIKLKDIIKVIIPNLILYIYFLIIPDKVNSQSINNAFYFMFVLLWFIVLVSQSSFQYKKLKYNVFIEKCGEVIIWSTIFIIGGIVIVGLSIALFYAIGIEAYGFYFSNIVTLGVVASPFISLLVIEKNSKTKLSVIIANIFLPIVLISLLVFGIISVFNNIKPYDNREIFIIYNVMNVIVICILIFTSISNINNKFIYICSYILPIITIILNVVTLSAVIYRLNEYGITPNKITLLGTNIVMLGNLIFIVYKKFKQRAEQNLEYLPVYFVWSLIVVFIFPFIFKFS